MALELRIAAPCPERWEDMQGDDRVRHCASCKLNVFNIRELTEAEVRALFVRANGGRVCGQIFQRRDGTVLTKDCPTGVAALRRKVVASVTMALALALTALGFKLTERAGCATGGVPETWFERVVTSRFVEAREELRDSRTFGPVIERFWPMARAPMLRGDIAMPVAVKKVD